MSSLFGESFDLPSFPNPDSFRRNVVPGPIPAPMLITETVSMSDLHSGNFVLWLSQVVVTVDVSQDGLSMWLVFPAGNRHEVIRGDAKAEKITHITFGSLDSRIPVEELRDDSIRYFGKFDDQPSEIVYGWSLDSADETLGHCDEIGWHASLLKFHTVSPYGGEWGNDPMLHQWHGELDVNTYEDSPDGLAYRVDSVAKMSNPAGAIVHEDDRGFVSVWFYRSLDDVNRAWSELQTMERDAYGPDEEDEDESSDDGACSLHGIIDCTAPECISTLLSEVRQAELWAGTE